MESTLLREATTESWLWGVKDKRERGRGEKRPVAKLLPERKMVYEPIQVLPAPRSSETTDCQLT